MRFLTERTDEDIRALQAEAREGADNGDAYWLGISVALEWFEDGRHPREWAPKRMTPEDRVQARKLLDAREPRRRATQEDYVGAGLPVRHLELLAAEPDRYLGLVPPRH